MGVKPLITLKYKFGTGLFNELTVSDTPPSGSGANFRNISIPFPSNYKPLSVLIWGKDYITSTGCSEPNSFRISSSLTTTNKFSFSLGANDSLNLNFPVDITKFSEMGVTSFNRSSCQNTISLVGKIVILYDKSPGDILRESTVDTNGKKKDSVTQGEIEYYSSSRYIGIL